MARCCSQSCVDMDTGVLASCPCSACSVFVEGFIKGGSASAPDGTLLNELACSSRNCGAGVVCGSCLFDDPCGKNASSPGAAARCGLGRAALPGGGFGGVFGGPGGVFFAFAAGAGGCGATDLAAASVPAASVWPSVFREGVDGGPAAASTETCSCEA